MSVILIVGGAPVVAQRHSVVNDCRLLLVTQTFCECVRLWPFKDKGKVKVKSICIAPIRVHESILLLLSNVNLRHFYIITLLIDIVRRPCCVSALTSP